jgi:hypothetical protein
MISLLKWWLLDNKMKYSPEEMEQYFYNLVVPSIQAISTKKENIIRDSSGIF